MCAISSGFAAAQDPLPGETPAYWENFLVVLAQAEGVLEGAAEGAPAETSVTWAYGYAAFTAYEQVEAQLGLGEILRTFRRATLKLGRSTFPLSEADHWFLWRCIEDLAAERARSRLALLNEPLFSNDDAQRPRLMREAAEIERLTENHDGSTPWLQLAFAELEALEASNPDDGRTLHLLATRLQLYDTAFAAELEAGAPDLAEPWLAKYEEILERETAQGAPRFPMWVLDGVHMRMRLMDSLGEHRLALEVAEVALGTPAIRPLVDQPRSCPELLRVLARRGMSLARLAREQGDQDALEGALAALKEVQDMPNLGLLLGAWIRLEQIRVLLDLDDPQRARTEIRAFDAFLGAHRPMREMAQALAVQQGRLVLADDQGIAALLASENQLRSAWSQLVEDRAKARPRREGLSVLWFPAQRDLLETLFRVQSKLYGPEEASLLGLQALLELQLHGSMIRELRTARGAMGDELEVSLPEGIDALVYFSGREALHVFALHSGRVLRQETTMPEERRNEVFREMQLSIRDVRRQPSGAAARRLVAASSQVASILLPSNAKTLLASRDSVVVCGLEDLPQIPFEYLPFLKGQPLGSSHAVEHSTSLPLWSELGHPAHRSRDSTTARVVSLVHLPRGANRIVGRLGRREFRNLHANLNSAAVQLLTGEDASISRLAKALQDPAQALLVMAHGVPQGTQTELLMAGGGRLGSARLRTMKLPGFVHFDTCWAGQRAKRIGDDGSGGLLDACLAGGAAVVSLPTWDIDVGVALQLREEVQRSLFLEGASVSEAWRSARLRAASKRGGKHEVEYYLHRVFGYGGETVTLHEPTPSRPMLWIGLLGSLFWGVAGYAWYRKKLRSAGSASCSNAIKRS